MFVCIRCEEPKKPCSSVRLNLITRGDACCSLFYIWTGSLQSFLLYATIQTLQAGISMSSFE